MDNTAEGYRELIVDDPVWIDDGADGGDARDQRLTVTPPVTAIGSRIDKVLVAALPELSRARIQALLAEGRVTANGIAIADASARVKAGHVLQVHIPPPVPAVPQPQPLPLSIVYEDDSVIVVDKPAGLVVHPAAGNPDGTLVNALLYHCGASLAGVGGVARPGIVHRLDKDTSGLLVAAKTDAAHRGLADQFATRTLCRTYLSIAWGIPYPVSGAVNAAIGRDPRDRKRMAVVKMGGKPALTHYQVREMFRHVPAALVECRLETGRTHQIRVHLAHIGHSVVGDTVYAPRRRPPGTRTSCALGFPRQALHAAELRFVHPVSGAMMHFAAALPADMQDLLRALRAP